MLFNSYAFLFAFLPATLLLYFAVGRRSALAAVGFLALASLFFYGWWNPRYLLLLCGSVGFNYLVGRRLARSPQRARGDGAVLWLGIACNLALLGAFKYAAFFAVNANALAGLALPVPHIVLPLGISFFTFTQIAYLVDAYRKEVREYRFAHYGLFVTFFPHLLAGPVLHHAEVMPQFARAGTFRFNPENFAVGLTIFAIGLFKKVVLADGIAEFATPVFDAAGRGATLTFLAAWGGALCYTFQLYFDFSGYSDMAIGLARLFGIVFPANFNSPYKAASIIDFWRRWHMTLSRFLRDYLYIPLGGGRCHPLRRHANLMATMLLGGLWHGAGWTFVIWGGLHGLYLVLNHAWREVQQRWLPGHALPRAFAQLLTFLAVVVAWVFFRADSFSAARVVLEGMAGMHGISKADPYYFGMPQLKGLLAMFVIAWGLPNAQQLLHRYRPVIATYAGELLAPDRLSWRPSGAWALLTAVLLLAAVVNLTHVSEFLYYQF
ncbi:MAG: MBOAT family protein [Burkholderiales bacterium]|jgi:D-alanyl-lipoteichoic acid acyltransferase DltB (MBOAT superfamily)